MSDRGTGKTTAQLAALPDGGVYLVNSIAFANYCRRILRDAGRCPRTSIRFATPGNYHRFAGARFTHFDVDHAYFELSGRREQEAYDFLRVCLF